ncbi:2,3-diaminopropionate biosynthesis protein SbnB [Paenibacillus arenilitoris]|uniref:2,3-diaminopropionate biosynthesis protein SbnB n=1 Tax=Paenibacillus arenilitoris TaxID=2772299 RepID=A0A927H972_9BACL|nr:2,3-diaminopropionate biosynthesis protein SbnB [Paenibacillus arenilitoris]MBD2871324.1 2,3-diaminopropionate biosynthesis protein SbnB [Paenibacillus arenilitoris]
MLYLGDRHVREIGLQWEELVLCVENAVRHMDKGEFAQPLKPYLRYGNPANRIIAMPAFIGGDVQTAGIKWIASFPGNIDAGIPRAHSVTLLNEAGTGIPYAMLNTPLPSAARTAAVSGLMIRHYLNAQATNRKLRLGIVGFGPVGQLHYDMCCKLFGDRLEHILLFDIRSPDPANPALAGVGDEWRARTRIVDSWETLFGESDIVITCTVSKQRYINVPPAPGTLLLDVSLRDYTLDAIGGVQAVIVDDWDEVCRENTDIELLSLAGRLAKKDTRSLADVVCRGALGSFAPDEPVLFCPMGMATFDIAVAGHLVKRAAELDIGIRLA